jgi:hypothetical protein
MLDVLKAAEQILPKLLTQPTIWQGLYVNYHHPYVERLWTQWGENRISLHKIYPCEREAALFHPHPWPQAAKILQGGYEMGVGYTKNSDDTPPLATRLFLTEGSAYEMVDPNGWHYVRPLTQPSFSLMVTGKPWQTKEVINQKLQLRSLSQIETDTLLATFRIFYKT